MLVASGDSFVLETLLTLCLLLIAAKVRRRDS